jgi:hypothetical protein
MERPELSGEREEEGIGRGMMGRRNNTRVGPHYAVWGIILKCLLPIPLPSIPLPDSFSA